MQTAVEWLDEQIQERIIAQDVVARKLIIEISMEDYMRLKQQAKEMERQQHGKTWDTALDKYEVRAGNYMRAYEDFDDYFAETYGSKGSDDEFDVEKEMFELELPSHKGSDDRTMEEIEKLPY